MNICRPVMRYPGGKYKLAPWIISHFPAHETYVELFGGAASVLMRKPRSTSEIYNDLNGDVVGVFRVLRDPKQSDELARLLSLTPYSREEYINAYTTTDDPVEMARRVIFRSFASHGSDGVSRRRAGFRTIRANNGTTSAKEWADFYKQIESFTDRLRGVVIENKPALECIKIYDRKNALFYVDPPYLKSVRTSRSVEYVYDMPGEDDHRALADALHSIQGMAIVSGYPSELYDHLYSDFRCVKKSHMAQHAKPTTECLWLSPNIHTLLFDISD